MWLRLKEWGLRQLASKRFFPERLFGLLQRARRIQFEPYDAHYIHQQIDEATYLAANDKVARGQRWKT